jgi:hypothetical protein
MLPLPLPPRPQGPLVAIPLRFEVAVVGVPPVAVRAAVRPGLVFFILVLDLAVRLGDPLVVASLPLLEILNIPGIAAVGRLLVAQPLLLGRLSVLPTPPEAG